MPTLDVRKHHKRRQIRGALQYDVNALLSEEPLTLPIPHDGNVVVYADDDETAERVAARLRHEGYEHAKILEGGFDAYEAQGLPTEEVTQQQPVPGSESGIPRI